MGIQIAVDSVRTLFVEMYWEHQLLASGTGFHYVCDGKAYFVTAWHNVAGRNAESGAYMSKHSVEPTYIRIHDRVVGAASADLLGVRDLAVVDNDGNPRWFEHPGRMADVVALPIDADPAFRAVPWEADSPGTTRNRLWVTEEVSIVGYPYGLRGGANLPIWIRGTIASEPLIPFQDRPLFLVDSRTRTGQSGSPVLLFYPPGTRVPIHDRNGVGYRYETNPVSRLIGVYSGRINAESDLGYVWTVDALDTICRDGVPGSYDPPLESMWR
ncbi:trypsin-like peptidase domain-containing protein [Nocardia salmonicida]|uniref:trypsin-like peptidase domain-containing protein n=1 Tax=Nocardia salmonicida TaxID=53431 RepID=UPI0036255F69